jgi:hypothetical protein
MARVVICGFEIDDQSNSATSEYSGGNFGVADIIVSSPVNGGGGYAMAFALNAGSEVFVELEAPGNTPLGITTGSVFGKSYFYIDSVAAPSAQIDYMLGEFDTSGGATVCGCYLHHKTDGTFQLGVYDNNNIDQATATVSINPNQWYRYEIQWVISTHTVTVYLDGVQKASTSAGTFTTTNVDNINCGVLATSASARNIYFDDVEVDNAQLCGASQVLCRQVKAGTPNVNSWTKVGGATIDLVWSDTPLNTATNANSTNTTAAIAQTGLTASFSSTVAGHGTGVISSSDTINGIVVMGVAKTSSTASGGAGGNVRRRFGGVNTDSAVTLATTDALYASAIFTDTLTNINASEIGWNKSASAAAATQTVEDMWMQVSTTFVAAAQSGWEAQGTQGAPMRQAFRAVGGTPT